MYNYHALKALSGEHLQVSLQPIEITAQKESATTNSTAGIDPKRLIEDALKPVQDDLCNLGPHLVALLGAKTASAKHIIDQVFSGGGKRIRPALFFMSAKLAGYEGEHATPIAAVCEYVHAASLLHDDVIDNSTLRRGKPTPNSIWGDESAVLVGDLVYSRASELMAKTGSLEIVSMFARSIRLMSEGELLQLEHLYNPFMPVEAYLSIIEYKTATLLGACCRAPSVLGGSPKQFSDALEEFGRCVGYAFQLLDDALDYAGSDEAFGKKTLADLPEGKVTLPVILLKEYCTPSEWSMVEGMIHEENISRESMLKVLDLVHNYDTVGKTLEIATEWTNKALNALSIFPASEAKSNLETLAKSLLLRIN
jgi:octaprenyl-diphosphate synthase